MAELIELFQAGAECWFQLQPEAVLAAVDGANWVNLVSCFHRAFLYHYKK
jgi:hypothetical protein